jgi:hypothetical protein
MRTFKTKSGMDKEVTAEQLWERFKLGFFKGNAPASLDELVKNQLNLSANEGERLDVVTSVISMAKKTFGK